MRAISNILMILRIPSRNVGLKGENRVSEDWLSMASLPGSILFAVGILSFAMRSFLQRGGIYTYLSLNDLGILAVMN